MSAFEVRPTYTAGYICERLNLGEAWKEPISKIMGWKSLDTVVSDVLIHGGPTGEANRILLALVAGIQIGIDIEREQAITAIKHFSKNLRVES